MATLAVSPTTTVHPPAVYPLVDVVAQRDLALIQRPPLADSAYPHRLGSQIHAEGDSLDPLSREHYQPNGEWLAGGWNSRGHFRCIGFDFRYLLLPYRSGRLLGNRETGSDEVGARCRMQVASKKRLSQKYAGQPFILYNGSF